MPHDPEFCRRVAEAIQGSPRLLFLEKGGELYLHGSEKRWEPDCDWNQAMFAAERVFGKGFAIHRASPKYPWRCIIGIERAEPGKLQKTVESEHKSGPKAICEAILRLKGQTNATG